MQRLSSAINIRELKEIRERQKKVIASLSWHWHGKTSTNMYRNGYMTGSDRSCMSFVISDTSMKDFKRKTNSFTAFCRELWSLGMSLIPGLNVMFRNGIWEVYFMMRSDAICQTCCKFIREEILLLFIQINFDMYSSYKMRLLYLQRFQWHYHIFNI